MTSRDFFVRTIEHEAGLFKKVLGAVLPGRLDWRPEPKARSAGELVGHIIGHPLDLNELATEGVIHHRNQVEFADMAEAIRVMDDAMAGTARSVAAMDDDAWSASAEMLLGEHVIWAGTTEEIAWGVLFDAIHHRGQLSTYLRPTGSKVPGIYGPSADDEGH